MESIKINDFTGNKVKILTKSLSDGVYCLKVDTTPDDSDYNQLFITSELIKKRVLDCDNYIIIGKIK